MKKTPLEIWQEMMLDQSKDLMADAATSLAAANYAAGKILTSLFRGKPKDLEKHFRRVEALISEASEALRKAALQYAARNTNVCIVGYSVETEQIIEEYLIPDSKIEQVNKIAGFRNDSLPIPADTCYPVSSDAIRKIGKLIGKDINPEGKTWFYEAALDSNR